MVSGGAACGGWRRLGAVSNGSADPSWNGRRSGPGGRARRGAERWGEVGDGCRAGSPCHQMAGRRCESIIVDCCCNLQLLSRNNNSCLGCPARRRRGNAAPQWQASFGVRVTMRTTVRMMRTTGIGARARAGEQLQRVLANTVARGEVWCTRWPIVWEQRRRNLCTQQTHVYH